MQLFFVTSCDTKNDKIKIAQVYDDCLYLADLNNLNLKNISKKDSLKIVKAYINDWINQKIILKNAKNDLENTAYIKDKVKNIEDDLYVYEYEKQYIVNNLDTIVADDEISEYYNNNKSNFNLKENILKVLYVKFDSNWKSKNDNIENLMKSDKIEDREKLIKLTEKYAVNAYLNDSSWLLFNDLLKEIPVKTYNQTDYLKYNKYIYLKNIDYQYHLYIKDFKIKDSESPLSYEYNKIKNIILNRRKNDLINDMRKNIKKDAYKKEKVKIFRKIS
ncbi:MAG: hypothetical protein A2X12_01085 [Bacteroidetes bacterium GWE2_29_8]|nr:MAG: hypothetical protein A2X12_01085 [Bacteroidetes bacterium GWE2_29_8]OFY14407.1 MAG: hypothetical protein A2X02_01220 [Bacteroidetes bacterium GWF2_29_10]